MKIIIERPGIKVAFVKSDGSVIEEHIVFGTQTSYTLPVGVDLEAVDKIRVMTQD